MNEEISKLKFLFSYYVSPIHLHRFFAPIRIYYHLMRSIFGKNYNPFETNTKEGLHPLFVFLKSNQKIFRIIYFGLIYTFPILLVGFILYLTDNYFIKRIYRLKKKND